MTFLSLYRKYRPRGFKDLVGQKHVVKTLQNALKHNRVAHAYLFAGPRGTGKTSTAKVFAQTLNCLEREGVEPCGECANCRRIQAGQSIDVIEIDAASNRGIDEIRDLREKVKFYPSEGSYKVYIIDEVHMLTKGAFNALLKTLEEPPESVVFILATTEPHKVIDTILSRCQRYDFSLLSLSDIKGRLEYICRQEEADYEEEALNIITRSSNGGMRDAISLLDQAISFTSGRITAEEIQQMLGKVAQKELNLFFGWIIANDAVQALELVNKLIDRGNSISVFVADLIEHTRRLLLIKECGLNSRILHYPGELLSDLQEEAGRVETARLFRMLEILTGVERSLTFTDQPRLVLEMGVMKMAKPAADSSLEGLQARIAALEARIGELSAGGRTAAGRKADGLTPGKEQAEPGGITEKGDTKSKDNQQGEAASRKRAAGVPEQAAVTKKNTAEILEDTAEVQQNNAEDHKNTVENQKNTAEIQRNIAENQKNTAEIQRNTAEKQQNTAGTQENTAETQDNEDNMEMNTEGKAETTARRADNQAAADEKRQDLAENPGQALSKIQDLWPEVLARVKDENISVQAYLLEGRPVMMKGELLSIEFPVDKGFHRKGAERESGLIKRVVSRLLGQPCQLEFTGPGDHEAVKSKKKAPAAEKGGEGLIEEIVKLFDGEIIKVDYSVLGEEQANQEDSQ